MNSKKLEVTQMQAKDRSDVLRFCRSAHRESIFGEIPFSERKFDRFFEHIIQDSDQHLGLAAKLSNRVLGVLYCCLGGYFVGEGVRVAGVNMVNIDKELRSTLLGGRTAVLLTRRLEEWAQAKSADFILYYVTSGETLPKTDRFFRKLGMTTLGGNYGMRLSR